MKGLIRFVLNHVPRKTIQRVVHFVTPVMGLAYTGRKVECPVCGHRYRKFMPYGYVHPRENALCPWCLSLERHRLLWLYLKNETDFFTAYPKVLHIAPERCFIKRFEKLLGDKYITADLESPLAKVKMDIQSIPFPDNEFDVIFCNHILEHVEDDRRAIAEMFRVMRPGGWGIMLSPVTPGLEKTREDASVTTPEGRLEAFGQRDHVREYGEDYPDRLAGAGFRVESIDRPAFLSPDQIVRYGLKHDIIYKVSKPLL